MALRDRQTRWQGSLGGSRVPQMLATTGSPMGRSDWQRATVAANGKDRNQLLRLEHIGCRPVRQILNLGMLFLSQVPCTIDLCAMVWFISRGYAWSVAADVSSG